MNSLTWLGTTRGMIAPWSFRLVYGERLAFGRGSSFARLWGIVDLHAGYAAEGAPLMTSIEAVTPQRHR
jgi:hypothetical protein